MGVCAKDEHHNVWNVLLRVRESYERAHHTRSPQRVQGHFITFNVDVLCWPKATNTEHASRDTQH